MAFIAVLASTSPGISGTLEEADSAFEKKDYEQAFEIYLPLAEKGMPEAMVRVAQIYKSGWLDHKAHESKALQWYLEAARHGNAEGAFGAARLYHKGRGVDQDYKAAADLYRQAAESGHAQAAAWLGELYLQGRGVDEDLEQAVAWFRLGAEESDRARVWLKTLKKRGQLPRHKNVIDKQDESDVKLKGEARQTITAVRTKSPSDIKVQAKEAEHEEQIEPPEAWAMTISGFAILFFAFIAFRFPKLFMDGRRSFFWKDMIGERATSVMIRIISFIVGGVGILLILGGVIILTGG